jgi:hypothetical protein
VVVVQTSTAGLLRKAGLAEGTVGILPLFLFAAGILLKPRAVEFIEGRRKTKQAGRNGNNLTNFAAHAPATEAGTKTVVHAPTKNGDLE